MEMSQIGKLIVSARKNRNLSQAQLAARLFISPQAVGKWERGESLPDILTFNRMAKILSVDLNYFSEDFGDKTKPEGSEYDADGKENIKKGQTSETLLWDMSKGNWRDADFSGLSGLSEKFSESNLNNCRFLNSDLSGILLKSNNIGKCDFSDCDFKGAVLQKSNLSNNLFIRAQMQEIQSVASYFSANNFSGADFYKAVFQKGGIEKSLFENVNIQHSTFREMYLGDLTIETNIADSVFENCSFHRIVFSKTHFQNTFFKGSNLKKVKFVDCTADRLSYEFLKSAGAKMEGIALMPKGND